MMNQNTAKQIAPARRVRFVQDKQPDMALVAQLLEQCSAANQWTNFGPLYHQLADEYSDHMNLPVGVALTPCANGGIALEMLARALAAEAGVKKLRWVGSAFSFKNLGRGYFSDMAFLDCDAQGVLELAELRQLPPDSFDAVVVTNPYGMYADFDRFIRFAQTSGKRLLIDNAAGIGRHIPRWPWQAFSLHHTKPYGIGEGGLALSPAAATGFLRDLINYGKPPADPAYWLNNGKISDIACAFLIARLQQIGGWEDSYFQQRLRIRDLFARFGASPLLAIEGASPTNCLPMQLPSPVDEHKLARPRIVDISRHYQPLAPTPRAQAIFSRLICFPTHPDMANLTDAQITDAIETLL